MELREKRQVGDEAPLVEDEAPQGRDEASQGGDEASLLEHLLVAASEEAHPGADDWLVMGLPPHAETAYQASLARTQVSAALAISTMTILSVGFEILLSIQHKIQGTSSRVQRAPIIAHVLSLVCAMAIFSGCVYYRKEPVRHAACITRLCTAALLLMEARGLWILVAHTVLDAGQSGSNSELIFSGIISASHFVGLPFIEVVALRSPLGLFAVVCIAKASAFAASPVLKDIPGWMIPYLVTMVVLYFVLWYVSERASRLNFVTQLQLFAATAAINVVGNEVAVYHLLHNATRNAVKHGARASPVSVEAVVSPTGSVTLALGNKPGLNHPKMLQMQATYGENWLLSNSGEGSDTKLLSTSGIGADDSTFQGMHDMRMVASCLQFSPVLTFNATRTLFTLPLGECLQPETVTNAASNISLNQVCILCADDQNAPRLQVMAAADKMGIPILQKRDMTDVKEGIFRDEPNLKLFGRTVDEVQPEVCQAVYDGWNTCPAVLLLDQNIAFGNSMCVYGTDICQHLRRLGFIGVIAIRSGNDSESDKAKYAEAGADETMPKTTTLPQLKSALERLAKVALARMTMATSRGGVPR